MHLALLAERYRQQGLTAQDAASAARRQFGNATLLQENRRELQTLPAVESVWRAVRYGARQLRATPVFTVAAVFSIALGIGGNAAVFTLLDQLVLRLLPVPEPERLVMVWSGGPNLGDTRGVRASAFPLCQALQRSAVAFDGIFCRYSTSAAIATDAETEVVRAELVSGNYFEALRVGPAAGRVFSAIADDRIDRGHPVVVLNHRYWTERFGGRQDIVGRKVRVNNHPMEVVGIAAAGFNGIDPALSPQVWLPVRMKAVITPEEDGLNDPHYDFVQVFGRMKAGYSVASAGASLQPLFHQLLEQQVTDAQIGRQSAFDRARFLKRTLFVERAATGYSDMRQQYSTALVVLMGMAALILLIACSNVASLLIARAMARQKEISVRPGDRRKPRHADRPAARREFSAGADRCDARAPAVDGGHTGAPGHAALEWRPPHAARRARSADPALRDRGIARDRTAVRARPSHPGDRRGSSHRFQGRRRGSGRADAVHALRKALVAAQVTVSFLLLVGGGLFGEH